MESTEDSNLMIGAYIKEMITDVIISNTIKNLKDLQEKK